VSVGARLGSNSGGIPAQGYTAEIESNGTVNLWRVDNWTLLGSSTISGFSLGTWYTLGLRANGSSISVEVNGSTVIGPVTNTAFTSGNAGVWSYSPSSAGSHRFDNPSTSLRTGFSITTLGGGVYRKVKVLAMTDARRRAVVSAPPANTTYRVYYYAAGRPIAMREMPTGDNTGTLYYLHSDHLGSTSVTTCGSGTCGAAGSVVARQWYYPYGAVRGSVGTLPTQRTFTGQYSDATGLMYFNARYYSQTLGRFVSADTIVPGAGEPQAFNRYAFVFNNPLKYYDPSGHASIPSCAGKPDCGIKDDPPQPPPDPCKVLGLLCKPPSSPISEADEIYEFGTSTLVLQIGPGGVTIHMTSGQNKGGSVRAKLGQLLLKVLPPGSAAAEWIRRIVCGGDCSDEVQTVINQIQRLPVPPTPGGITVSEFGQKVMQWGTGSEAARARISTITAEELRKAQLTVDMAIRWRDFYINELARNPNNPSAAGRAELMDYVVRLLGGK
jgi:RHS repeat-associated protein